jgi:hypothetical protein
LTSDCCDLPEPYGEAPAGGFSHLCMDDEDVFSLAASPPHSNEDIVMSLDIDMSEASQAPLPYDEDDDMVPAGDEVKIPFIFSIII